MQQNKQLKIELKKLENQIPVQKANKLEELLVDLANEMMDNYREQ